MLATDEAQTVSLYCDASVMKAVIDCFGHSIRTKAEADYPERTAVINCRFML